MSEQSVEVEVRKRSHPYAQIDNRPLRDKRLSYRARGILAYLLSKPSNWRVRTEDIIANGTEGRDAVRAAFQELANLHYAVLVNTQNGREWRVYEEPQGEQRVNNKSACPENPSLRMPWKSQDGLFRAYKNTDKERILNHLPEIGFDEFWKAYPRKVAKQDAVKAWKKIRGVELHEILSALGIAKKTRDWKRDKGQFIPYPATWLNGGRWMDEYKASNDASGRSDQVLEARKGRLWTTFVQRVYPNAVERNYFKVAQSVRDEFEKWVESEEAA